MGDAGVAGPSGLVSPGSAMLRFVSSIAASLVAAACIVAAPPADAATVGVHLASVHLPQRDFNNTNPGLYLRTDAGWTAGAYRNSLRRTSAYAGYTMEWGPVAVTGGIVTGYAETVQPLMVPSLKLFTLEGVSARVAFIPRVEKRIESHVFHLTLEYALPTADAPR
jgi:hypothetical protein